MSTATLPLVGEEDAREIGRAPSAPSIADHAYRPDIDGLRSIAVVPVVLFHAGIGLFQGGYVGVDIFFAISGFLITRILVGSMQEGRYSILDFYERRARRIFPALAVMVLVTLAAGWIVLTPSEYSQLGGSVVSIGAFLSNFHFWKSVGYFEAATAFHPLLHTWSLAVEEQFYIFFPILLYFLHGNRRLLIPLLAVIFVVSLASSVVLLDLKPRIAFYWLPPRAWELMAGGMLALGMCDRFWSRRAAVAASLLGLALIAGPIFFYTAVTPFPGLAAVPPVLGACLLIWAKGEGAGRLLAAKPMVWIGLLSYSLYLWHLPIFEFAKYLLGGELPVAVGLGLSLVSVLAAWLSLRFVERPFRKSGPRRTSKRSALIATAALAATVLGGQAIVWANGVPSRMPAVAAQTLMVAGDKQRHPIRCMSLDDTWVAPEHACRLGAPVAPTALLWGDSHALVTATALEAVAKRRNAAFLFAADADCPIGLGFTIDPDHTPAVAGQGHYRRCGDYNAAMLAVALRPEIQTVVLASRWTTWRIGAPANPVEQDVDIRLRTAAGLAPSVRANRAIFEHGFTQLVDELRQAGKRVVIVGPIPEPPYDVPHRAYVSRFGFVAPPADLTEAGFRQRHAVILAYFRTLAGKADFVWPDRALCRDGRCPVTLRGVPRYFDHNHLSVATARQISPIFDVVFQPADGSRTPAQADRESLVGARALSSRTAPAR